MKETEFYERLLAAGFTDSQSRTANIRNHEYIKLRDGSIYKYQPKHDRYIKVSPYATDEDRILRDDPFLSFEALSKREAGSILNEQWDKHDAEWVHDGKRYCTNGVFHEEGTTCNPCPEHRDSGGVCYFIGYYRGHLYKVIYYSAWDDLSFVELRPYEPLQGKFMDFRVRTKHVKMVLCKTDNKYI